MNNSYVFNNVAESIVKLTDKLLNEPDYVSSPRNQKINELISVSLEIKDVTSNMFYNEIRATPKKYLANELLLYFSGESELKKYSNISPFWKKLYPNTYIDAVNSAYGNLLFNSPISFKNTKIKSCNTNHTSQWDWAKNSLIRDKDSRQAIMHYNRPDHQYEYNGDFVCTLTSQFLIRKNKLHLITNMRSQDIHYGYTFDVVFFTLLIQCMRLELINIYPELELGHYFHNVGSFHMYERNFDTYEKMRKYDSFGCSLPLIQENPILNENIIDMVNNIEYKGNDSFFKWLDDNRK